MRTPWADGPEYVTQCPIQPGAAYTYRFTIENQDGTLWWHAHSKWLRATVYGALIIYPKLGVPYPFPKPNKELPILLGEWWDRDIISVLRQAIFTGAAPNVSEHTPSTASQETYTDAHPKSHQCRTQSRTLLHRRQPHADRGRKRRRLQQTLLHQSHHGRPGPDHQRPAHRRPARRPLLHGGACVPQRAERGVRQHHHNRHPRVHQGRNLAAAAAGASTVQRHEHGDRVHEPAAEPGAGEEQGPNSHRREALLHGGVRAGELHPGPPVPGAEQHALRGQHEQRVVRAAAEQLAPAGLLQRERRGVYTVDFPGVPPVAFDYTGNVSRGLWQPRRGTKLYRLKYGSRVQIVLQDTAIVSTEDHPVHLHGYHFHVVGQGFGNFNPSRDAAGFNLVDPPVRNTINVPVGGWAVIRFVADNPGVWLMHCHIDSHLSWGFAMAFVVENGKGKLQSVEAPPPDLPPC
uniref:Laccase 20 n=1 Tax=Salvia miltiorrhiza TaxID=226208 RepID=A0A4Y5RR87_SALMI|nr:laccase 20 [Salvia miltiorrhiza]